jgi:hypothetical protein
MRTAVPEGHDATVGPVQHPGFAQQHEPAWLWGHLGWSRHRVPAPPQRGIDVRKQVVHGGTPWCAALAGVKKTTNNYSSPP